MSLQSDCEDNVDCITQAFEPNNFVLLKSAKKKTVKYSVGLIQEMGPDDCNTWGLNMWLIC